MFIAVLIDKELGVAASTRRPLPSGWCSLWHLPVHLAADLLHGQGLLNAVTGLKIDWYGDAKYNLWAVLVATGWQHAGYIMLLYLAGLKSVDPALREAAAVDGANQVQTFFQVSSRLAADQPHRAGGHLHQRAARFDIVWIVNKGERTRDHRRPGHPEHRWRSQPDRLRFCFGHHHAGDFVGIRRHLISTW
jgi:multiple sugar transport system permease protein